jgi:hypothetical protein
VRVNSATVPGNGYQPADPDLEDVYFSTMARRQHGAEPAAIEGTR